MLLFFYSAIMVLTINDKTEMDGQEFIRVLDTVMLEELQHQDIELYKKTDLRFKHHGFL
ncbi:hypothetical protein D3C74_457650 [compost metagenome]